MKHRDTGPFRRIYIILALLLLAGGVGVLGFMVIEHYSFLDALYMTIITVSTVGYGEVHPLSPVGKVFNIVLIVTNLGLVTYAISVFTRFFLDGEFQQHIKIRKMERSIDSLRGHTIICGFGRNGHAAANVLRQNNAPFVVIERRLHDKQHVEYYIESDATREEVLIEAGIRHAAAVLITLPVDAENVYIVLSARELNPDIRIISRASDDHAVKKMKIAGADNVIMPDKIGGTHMATLALNPDVKQFMDIMASQGFEETTIQELTIGKPSTLAALNAWRTTGATILGIKNSHQKYIMNPGYEDTVKEGDKIMVMGSKDQISALEALVR